MLKLMALEIRKNKLMNLYKGVVIVNLSILAFMILVIFMDRSEDERSEERRVGKECPV